MQHLRKLNDFEQIEASYWIGDNSLLCGKQTDSDFLLPDVLAKGDEERHESNIYFL